jgi:hypothetical protein
MTYDDSQRFGGPTVGQQCEQRALELKAWVRSSKPDYEAMNAKAREAKDAKGWLDNAHTGRWKVPPNAWSPMETFPLCRKCRAVYIDHDELHCGRCCQEFALCRRQTLAGKKRCQTEECRRFVQGRTHYCETCIRARRREQKRSHMRSQRAHDVEFFENSPVAAEALTKADLTDGHGSSGHSHFGTLTGVRQKATNGL